MKTNAIGLIACSSLKLGHAARARELYCSPLFRLSLAYAEARCAKTYVLSAMHGLVDLDDVIRPYDLRLKQLAKHTREQWGRDCARAYKILHEHGTPMLLLAGADYALAFRAGMGNESRHITEPLKGLMIGHRLSFLGTAVKAAA